MGSGPPLTGRAGKVGGVMDWWMDGFMVQAWVAEKSRSKQRPGNLDARPRQRYRLDMQSTFVVSKAQAQLSRIVNRGEIVGIKNRVELRGYYVPRERFEALLETMELLSAPHCLAAVRRFEAGKMKFHDWKQVKRELEAAE